MLPFRSILTADGVISSRNPFLTTRTCPLSTTAISEFVVPRSIPKSIVFLVIDGITCLSDNHLSHLVERTIEENGWAYCLLHNPVDRLVLSWIIKCQDV